MKWPSKEEVKKIREKYPEGTIIKLIRMDDPSPIPSGTIGAVISVDDIGQLHCLYLNYRSSLAIVPSKDIFEVIPKDKVIYPCNEDCPGYSEDLEDPKPYLCMFDDHYSESRETLWFDCPKNKKPTIVE